MMWVCVCLAFDSGLVRRLELRARENRRQGRSPMLAEVLSSSLRPLGDATAVISRICVSQRSMFNVYKPVHSPHCLPFFSKSKS